MKQRLAAGWRSIPQSFKLVAAVFAVVILQFLYPSDRLVPFARLDGTWQPLVTTDELKKRLLDDYGTVALTTTVRGKVTKVTTGEVGVTPDTTAIATQLSDYPWYLRLIPFSLLVRGLFVDQPVMTVASSDAFTVYASERAKECEVPAKDAAVVVKDGEPVLDSAKTGEACTVESIKKQVLAKPLTKKTPVELAVKTTVVQPARSDADVQGLLEKAREILERQVDVSVADKVYVLDKTLVASWLVFPENPETKQLEVGLSDDTIKAYLETVQKDVYIAPGTTLVTTFDGVETGRAVGSSGRGINLDATTAKIRTQVLTAPGRVVADISTLAPSVRYNRSYSSTPAGLQALVNDLAAGKNMAISVRRLADSGVSANGDKQYHPASTYKLFVAYSVIKRIDAGSMSWGQAATNGQTVSQCFDNMIVNSDNICAEWFGGTVGWGAVEADARGIGAGRTSFTRTATFLSTANDLALLLQKLESNQLGVSEPSRARLLDAMKRQRYRQGIPAGVKVAVADKVGFLEAKLHDAAIVYAPSGVYVLVILSDGSSWAEIASVANQIHTQLSR